MIPRLLCLWFFHNFLFFKKKTRSAKRCLGKASSRGLDTTALSLSYRASMYTYLASLVFALVEMCAIKTCLWQQSYICCLFKLSSPLILFLHNLWYLCSHFSRESFVTAIHTFVNSRLNYYNSLLLISSFYSPIPSTCAKFCRPSSALLQ